MLDLHLKMDFFSSTGECALGEGTKLHDCLFSKATNVLNEGIQVIVIILVKWNFTCHLSH